MHISESFNNSVFLDDFRVSFERSIISGLETLPDISLPIIGNSFKEIGIDIVDTIDDSFDTLTDTLIRELSVTEFVANEVAQELNSISGLEATVASETQDQIEFLLDYENSFNIDVPLFSKGGGLLDFIDLSDNFDLVNASVEIDYAIDDYQFGFDSDGFIDDKTSTTFDINVNIDLPDTTIDGLELGLVDIELNEPEGGNNFGIGIDVNLNQFDGSSFDIEVDYSDLEIIDLFSFNVAVPDGSIFVPGIGEIVFGFPEVDGKLQLDLSNLTTLDADFSSNIPFKLADITLDLESIREDFINPFVSPILELTKPLQEVIGILYEPVPLLNDLAQVFPDTFNALDRGGNINGIPEISLRDIIVIAAEFKNFDVDFLEFFDQGFQISEVFNNLDIEESRISLGDLEFNQGNFIQQPQNVDSLIGSSLPEGIGIPLLERPTNVIFDLLLGNSTDLITYSTPMFKFEETIGANVPIPILPPLAVFVGGNFDIEAQFSFGFDTYGLSTGFLEDGFYINDRINGEDTQEVTFNIGPRVGPAIEVGVASLATFFGYSGGIGLNWNDDDGRFRLDELNEILVDSFEPFELFDLGINLGAGFGGEVNLAGITLWRPELNGSIEIAEISGTEIQINVDELLNAGQDAVDFLARMYNIFSEGIDFNAALDFSRFLVDELGTGLIDVSKFLFNQFEIGLVDTTRILINLGADFVETASALWNAGIANTFELANVLWNETSAGVVDIALALRDVVGRDASEIFADLFVGAGVGITRAVEGLWNGAIVSGTFELASVLWNETSAGVVDIALALRDVVGRNAGGIVADLVSGAGLSFFDAGIALWDIGGVISNSDDLISALWNQGASFDDLVNVLVSAVGFSSAVAIATVNSFLGLVGGGRFPSFEIPSLDDIF